MVGRRHLGRLVASLGLRRLEWWLRLWLQHSDGASGSCGSSGGSVRLVQRRWRLDRDCRWHMLLLLRWLRILLLVRRLLLLLLL